MSFSSHHYNEAIQDESTVLQSHKTCEIKLQLVLCGYLGHIGDKLGGKQAMALWETCFTTLEQLLLNYR